MIRVLYVAYPLLAVSCESAGGAEQVLWTLEREMARAGMETVVAAAAGSRVTGELFATGEPCEQSDDLERRSREHQDRTVELALQRAREGRPFSLIHDQSGSFWPAAAAAGLPLLATLHLPRSFYPSRYFEDVAANVAFNCVSDSQARDFGDLAGFQGAIPNGIALDLFEAGLADGHPGPRRGLLWLGRICEEKAPHLALDIAARLGMPAILAGQVYPFSYHRRYFNREIAPRLRSAPESAFLPLPSRETKLRLLRETRAVLITSQVDETSSLVAMEAAASGTPVIAFARGALTEIVQDGRTGFLVESVEAATAAVGRLTEISSQVCAHYAREHFGSIAMAEGYSRLYARVLAGDRRPSSPLAAR